MNEYYILTINVSEVAQKIREFLGSKKFTQVRSNRYSNLTVEEGLHLFDIKIPCLDRLYIEDSNGSVPIYVADPKDKVMPAYIEFKNKSMYINYSTSELDDFKYQIVYVLEE